METFTLKVIGFSRVFYEGEAVQAQLPIQDGSMGIMAHHEAAVIGIVPGTMRLQTPDGEWQSAVVDAGFARVGENTVSVMVEEVLRPEEIDEERERRGVRRAQAIRLISASIKSEVAMSSRFLPKKSASAPEGTSDRTMVKAQTVFKRANCSRLRPKSRKRMVKIG